MSAFIGSIHYWLYDKIRLVAEREAYILNKAFDKFGLTAEEVQEEVWQKYGAPLSDADLSELIDHDNIHGWLQRQINIAESREADFINELITQTGEEGARVIKEAFLEHGKMTGERAKNEAKYDAGSAPGIYKALNDFYLNGMPCDQGDMVKVSESESVIWEIGACLQETNWKRAGADVETMLELYQSWIREFVTGLNAKYSFRSIETGMNGLKYEIYRKG